MDEKNNKEKTKIVTVHKTRETPLFYEDKTVGEYVHFRRHKREDILYNNGKIDR